MARNTEILIVVKMKNEKIIVELDRLHYRINYLKNLFNKFHSKKYYRILFLLWLICLIYAAFPYGIEVIAGIIIIIFTSFMLGWKNSSELKNKIVGR